MKMKKLFVPLGFILAVMIYFYASDAVVAGVKNGLKLCYNVIIPSLYPFMIISTIVGASPYADAISLPSVPFFRLLNINNRRVMTCCILSILGGFATGGYFLNMINTGENCPENMIKVLSVVFSLNSPAFVITAVGAQMLGSTKIGILLYVSVVFSAYITAFIMSFLFPFEDKSSSIYPKKHISFVEAVTSSLYAIINICSVVIVVSALCQVIMLYSQNSFVTWAFSLVCEVTAACNFVTQNFDGNLYMICISLCILPVSSYLQIKGFDKSNTINLKPLVLSKLLQIPVAVAVLRILINLFPTVCSVYANGDISVNTHWNRPVLSLYLVFLSVCFVLFFDRKAGLSKPYTDK